MWNIFSERFFENKKYGIVIDFFTSTFHQNNLKEVLSELTYGNRYGDEYLGCCLSTLYDEDEKAEEGYFEDGVLFYECDEEETAYQFGYIIGSMLLTIMLAYIGKNAADVLADKQLMGNMVGNAKL